MTCDHENIDWQLQEDGSVRPRCRHCGEVDWAGSPCPQCGRIAHLHRFRVIGGLIVCPPCREELVAKLNN